MSLLGPELPGAEVLDLFAGAGALGLEALSRGARHATFLESAPSALRTLHANIRTLDALDQTRVVRGDAFRFIRALDELAFDLAVADPPYQEGFAATLVEGWLERPFSRILSIEHARGEPVPEVAGALERRYGDTILTTYVSS